MEKSAFSRRSGFVLGVPVELEVTNDAGGVKRVLDFFEEVERDTGFILFRDSEYHHKKIVSAWPLVKK
jgi:hypothetical protein